MLICGGVDLMDPNIIGLIIAGILFAAPVVIVIAIVLFVVFKVKSKVSQFERESGIKIEPQKFVDDLKGSPVMQHAPASLNGMDKIYVPMIKKEFPDLDLSAVFSHVEMVMKTYLDCIEEKNTSELENKMVVAPVLVQKAQAIITDLQSQNKTVYYDNIVIHKSVISDYVKEKGLATISFQCAVGYLNHVEDQNGKMLRGSKEISEETVYVLKYSRVINQELAKQSGEVDVLAVSCPNCGAPIPRGSVARCPYCRTEFHNMTEDVFAWAFTDIKEKNLMTKKIF